MRYFLFLLSCGLLSIAWAQAPANDHFTNATPLYGSSVTFTGTLVNAASQIVPCPVYPDCGFYTHAPAVWWSWTPSNSTQVVIDLLQQSGAQDAWFIASTGVSTNSLTYLDANALDSVPHRYLSFAATARLRPIDVAMMVPAPTAPETRPRNPRRVMHSFAM